jgi:hypothetical protein
MLRAERIRNGVVDQGFCHHVPLQDDALPSALSSTTWYIETDAESAIIYSTADWWSTCTGNSADFSSTSPLWLARYSSSVGTIPGGWP